ncbi:MAG: hypothetical protein IKB02_03135, partial [Clostridia bacterium]|nr:hypothetical protein [Clostridia bacterium]
MRKLLTILSISIVILMVILAIPTFAAETPVTPKADYTNPEFYTDASGNKINLTQNVYHATVVEGDLDWKIGDSTITADEKKAMAKGVRYLVPDLEP